MHPATLPCIPGSLSFGSEVSLKEEDAYFLAFALLPGTWLWWLEPWQESWNRRPRQHLSKAYQNTGKNLGP